MASADAALGHQHDFAFEQLRDARIREIEHRADAGVPGPFDDHEILFPRRAIEGILDAPDEKLVVLVLDVAPGEIRLDRDRAHRFQRRLHAEGLVDQHRVFVDALSLDFDEALPDRLDESDPPEPFSQRGKQAERGGGFAVVLLRGGDETAAASSCSCAEGGLEAADRPHLTQSAASVADRACRYSIACRPRIAATPRISSSDAPRDRSAQGFERPSRIWP